MKIGRKWFYGMTSAGVVALIVALNTASPVGNTNNVNAMEQAITGVKINNEASTVTVINTDAKSNTKTNVGVLAHKDVAVKTLSANEKKSGKPQVEVPVDLQVEKGDQKNADAGSSPWKLDPMFVAQVFVSLKISPEGIQGDYPVKYEEIKLVESTEKEAVLEVSSKKSTIGKVYLKRLVKQDNTGIWTVVGYDSVNNK
jgi:hypothetical protein